MGRRQREPACGLREFSSEEQNAHPVSHLLRRPGGESHDEGERDPGEERGSTVADDGEEGGPIATLEEALGRDDAQWCGEAVYLSETGVAWVWRGCGVSVAWVWYGAVQDHGQERRGAFNVSSSSGVPGSWSSEGVSWVSRRATQQASHANHGNRCARTRKKTFPKVRTGSGAAVVPSLSTAEDG